MPVRHDHENFWLELAGKVGPPIFAATLVGSLLSRQFELMHGVLMGVGLALIGLHHWSTFHRHG